MCLVRVSSDASASCPRRRPRRLILELRYVGFDQTQNTRFYRFEKLVNGEAALRFVITADLALFLEHRISLQEGPSLCAVKLASDLACHQLGEHQLTNADLVAHLTVRASADAHRTELRTKRAQRAAASRRLT